MAMEIKFGSFVQIRRTTVDTLISWTNFSSWKGSKTRSAWVTLSPLKHTIQKNKGNNISQRLARRIIRSEAENIERSERYFEAKMPKTMNNVFGTFEDCLYFLSRRFKNLQIWNVEKWNDLGALNKKVLSILVDSFDGELKKRYSLGENVELTS